ncbi:hypothetical protein [Fibrella aquatica]|uniref:hypothetical protein n=1 Tax=Fibrella aquatica TaxID=3242487 RepID=UPI003522E285
MRSILNAQICFSMTRFSLLFLCGVLLANSWASAQASSQSSKVRTPVFRVKFYVDGNLIDPKLGMPASTNDFRIDIESPDPAREKIVLKKAVVTLVSGTRRVATSHYYPSSKTPSGTGWKATAGDRVVVELSDLLVERPGENPTTLATRTVYALPLH